MKTYVGRSVLSSVHPQNVTTVEGKVTSCLHSFANFG